MNKKVDYHDYRGRQQISLLKRVLAEEKKTRKTMMGISLCLGIGLWISGARIVYLSAQIEEMKGEMVE